MADQDRNSNNQTDENARGASGSNSSNASNASSSNRGRDQSQTRNQSASGSEQDDVAEDRNLSGASTWLNLPDKQPSGDQNTDDNSSRDRGHSNR